MTDRHWTPPVGLDQRTDDAAEEEPIRGAECNAACSIARQRPTPTPIGGMLPPADYASNERTCERPYPGACPEVCPAAICDPHLGDVSRGNSHLGVGRLGAHPEGVAVECAKLSCLDSQGTALATLNWLIACDLAPMRDANALPLHGTKSHIHKGKRDMEASASMLGRR